MQAIAAERLGTGAGPVARVSLGLVFRIDRTQIHAVGDSSAADLAAVKQRVLLAEGPFGKARADLANVLQAGPAALPIVWSQRTAEETSSASCRRMASTCRP